MFTIFVIILNFWIFILICILEGQHSRKEWYFRHDKVIEFFIVQTFLGDTEKPLEHLDDPRFRGVYFLLVNLLPLPEAMILREQLIEYAADTQDHLVSDKFIQLLRSRKMLEN